MANRTEMRQRASLAAFTALGFIGLAAIVYGTLLIYRPAAFILGGALALAIAILKSLSPQ